MPKRQSLRLLSFRHHSWPAPTSCTTARARVRDRQHCLLIRCAPEQIQPISCRCAGSAGFRRAWLRDRKRIRGCGPESLPQERAFPLKLASVRRCWKPVVKPYPAGKRCQSALSGHYTTTWPPASQALPCAIRCRIKHQPSCRSIGRKPVGEGPRVSSTGTGGNRAAASLPIRIHGAFGESVSRGAGCHRVS